MTKLLVFCVSILSFITLCTKDISANPVYIENPSFESDVPEDGGWGDSGGGSGINNTGFITGWVMPNVNGYGGSFRPTTIPYPSGIPDGLNVAWLNGPELYQILSETVTASTSYTLQVYVGNRAFTGFRGYAVQLWAEGNLLAEENFLNPEPGQFLPSIIEYTALPGDSSIGLPLEIRLLSGGVQANFDMVSLEASPLYPHPTQILSPVLGSIGTVKTDADCPALYSQGKWCFNQHQTGLHEPLGGIGNSDDTNAWDINLNYPTEDMDKSKPVYSVEEGIVAPTYAGEPNAGGPSGQLLIEHDYNGSKWWSGYLHLRNIQVSEGQVVTDKTLLGFISDVGTDNNHLHLVFYYGENISEGLISFDTNILERRPLRADLDKDGDVDGYDLSIFSNDFGKTKCLNCPAQLSVPIYGQGQQDQIWKDDQLGTCIPETLASHGCAVTSIAMVFKYYGIETDPRDLNDWLTQNDGYYNDCRVIWDRAAAITDNKVLYFVNFDYSTIPANLDIIRHEINNGYPVIAQVLLSNQQHFVVITGYIENTFIINDPWHADTSTINSRYGTDPAYGIQGIILYHKK